MKLKRLCFLFIFTALVAVFLAGEEKNTKDTMFQEGIQKMKAGELKDAEALFKKVIEAQPYHILAHMNLGIAYIKMNKPAEAEPELVRAAHLSVREAQPHIMLGQFYLQQGDKARASEQLRRAFDLDPDASVCAQLAPHLGWKRAGKQWLSPAEKALLEKAPDKIFGFSPGELRSYSHHYKRGKFKDWEGKTTIVFTEKRIVQGTVAYRFLSSWNYMGDKSLTSMDPGSRESGGKLYVSLQENAILDVTPEGFPLHYAGSMSAKVLHYIFSGDFSYDFTPEGIRYSDTTNNVNALAAEYRYSVMRALSDFDKVEIGGRYLGGMTKDQFLSIYKERKNFFVDHIPLLRNIPLYLFLQSGENNAKYGQSKIIFPNTGDDTFKIARNLSDIASGSNFPIRDLVKFYPQVFTVRDFDFSKSKDKIKVHDKELECYKVKTDFYESIDFWVLENGKIIQVFFPVRDEIMWLDEDYL